MYITADISDQTTHSKYDPSALPEELSKFQTLISPLLPHVRGKLTHFIVFLFIYRKHTRSSTSNAEVGNIENEYIRNLQQQIYFLELEANYLYPFLAISDPTLPYSSLPYP